MLNQTCLNEMTIHFIMNMFNIMLDMLYMIKLDSLFYFLRVYGYSKQK